MLKYSLLALVLLSGCSEPPDYTETRSRLISEQACPVEVADSRADYMLQCIKNANPKSDEEPEDWLYVCKNMANDLYCKDATYRVTEQCAQNTYGNNRCSWVELDRVAL